MAIVIEDTVVVIEVPIGLTGAQGLSTYELAVSEGFVGTLAEWLAATEADRVQTSADVIATAADRVQTGLDATATAADSAIAAQSAITAEADSIQTALDRLAVASDKDTVVASTITATAQADIATTKAGEALASAAASEISRLASGVSAVASEASKVLAVAAAEAADADAATVSADKGVVAADKATVAADKAVVNDIAYGSQITLGASSGAITIDWTAGRNQLQPEPTGTITYTFTNPAGPCHLQLIINSDGTSTAQTINLPAGVTVLGAAFAPVNNKKSFLNFWFDGTNYFMIASNEV